MYTKIQGNLKPIKGTIPFIKAQYEQNIPLAVASSSKIDFVQKILKELQIDKYFTVVIGGDMVKKGKPDPEIFLLASSKIQIPPKDCLVIEDGISGMTAAKEANMFCIGIVKDINQSYPTKNLVQSLESVDFDFLNNLKK
jgi:HAD superfamily hydrolase (TIGR01509 family)